MLYKELLEIQSKEIFCQYKCISWQYKHSLLLWKEYFYCNLSPNLLY